MTLLELLHLMRQKWYLLVVFPVVLGLGTAAYCWGFMANDYTSNVTLYVLTETDDSASMSSSQVTVSQQLANDIAVIAETSRVTTAAANKLGLEDLEEYKIEVSSATTNRVITLSVTGKDSEMAASVANQLAEEIAEVSTEAMNLKAINVIDEARVSTVPSGPNRLLYTAVAILAGLFIATAIIVLIDMIDTTVKSKEEVEKVFELPVLGSMPTVKKGM